MSGPRFLLDTNVAIGLLKGNADATTLKRNLGVPTGGNAISQISRIELLGFPGMTKVAEIDVRRFIGFCQVLLIDDTVETKTIELRRATRLKLPDAIILATALAHGLRLVTLDRQLEAVAAAEGMR